MAYYRTPPISNDLNLRAYIIGVALGDGNLSNVNGRATRLRITCDKKYPYLMEKISLSLKNLLPSNRVSFSDKGSCADVVIYSNHLESLLGWRANYGPKYDQGISIPRWIFEEDETQINCLRGLLETDGTVYLDRKYKMVMFYTIVERLAKQVYAIMLNLGFMPRIYTLKPRGTKAWNKKDIYHVRLSRDVDEFLNLIRIEKR